MSRARAIAALAAFGFLTACDPVGPEFQRPSLDAGESFRAETPALVGEAAPDTAWWSRFDDPRVPDLIRRGLAANPDIAAAETRLREAEALRRSARSARFPTLDGELGGDTRYTRRLGGGGGGEDDGASAGLSVAGVFGWTADLFGRERRAEEAARAEQARRAWLREAVALDVAGDVASTFVDLRGLEERLALGLESLDLQERTLALVSGRVAAGLAPDLDMTRAEGAVARLRAELAPLRTDIGRTTDSLAVLLGQPPSRFELPPAPGDVPAIPSLLGGPAIGLPVDVVRRRPDLRAAEFALAASTAEIGVAQAELFPELSLPGSLSLTADGLGTGSIVRSVVGALSATLDIPLLDAGGRAAGVDAAEARAAEALELYRSTLLTALGEVEGALRDYDGAQQRLTELDVAVDADRRAVEQAQGLYTGGLVTFSEVLDSQTALTEALQQRAAARTDVTLAAIALYRAAGFAPCLSATSTGDGLEECPDGEAATSPPAT
ncbi:MAG: efflux transporter outer membrane subunit [Azospirillaceae bacterium]